MKRYDALNMTHRNTAMKSFLFEAFVFFFAFAAYADYTDDCITFSSKGTFTLKTRNGARNWDGTLWTSGDKSRWTEWDGGEVSATRKDDAWNLYVRGDTNNTVISYAGYTPDYSAYSWVITTNGIDLVSCSGNIETLRGAIGNDPSPKKMGVRCYNGMFSGNVGLKTSPCLTAMKLAGSCYFSMFAGCKSITTAPDLPATNLSVACYNMMFSRCDGLRTPPKMPATHLAKGSCAYMFSGCSMLTAAPSLPAKVMVTNCYQGMFQSCKSLIVAPVLPATNLDINCYYRMFAGCDHLKEAPELPATELKLNCYYEMFQNCTNLKLAHDLPALTASKECCRSMFQGCTSLCIPPALPATNLAESCYAWMFQDCKSLKTVPLLPAKIHKISCYWEMFKGCSSLAIYDKPPGLLWKFSDDTVWAQDCVYGMFKGISGSMNFIEYSSKSYFIASAPAKLDVATVGGASFSVITNGALVAGLPCVITYATPVKVVYTAQDGFMFPGGSQSFTTNIVINADSVTVQLPQDQMPILKPVEELIAKPVAVGNLVYNGFSQQGVTNIDNRLIILAGTTSSVDVVVTNSIFSLPAKVVSTANILGTNYYWKGETEAVAKTNDITIVWSLAPRSVTIKSADATKIFDGSPITSNEVNVIAGSFASSEMFAYSVTGKQTGIGWSTNFYTFADNVATGTKTNNYVVTQEYGILTILPIPMVTIVTNGLDVSGASFSFFTNGTKVAANELGQYVVESNEIIAVRYKVLSEGNFFTDGTTAYETTFKADTLMTYPEPLIKKPDSPKPPNIKLGAVAQRYPWNGVLDVRYWAMNTPSTGYDIVLTVKLPDDTKAKALVSSQSYPAVNGKHKVDFDAREAFGEIVLSKGVKVTAKLVHATP